MEKIGRVEVKNVGMVDEKFCQLSIRRRALKQPSLLDRERNEVRDLEKPSQKSFREQRS